MSANDPPDLELLRRLVHELRNVGFALRALSDGMSADRPTGELLDQYVGHFQAGADRLVELARGLSTIAAEPILALAPIQMEDVVTRALAQMPPAFRPAAIQHAAEPLPLDGDLDQLAGAVAAMLRSFARSGTTTLRLERVDVEARPCARVVAEGTRVATEGEPAQRLWELAAGYRLEQGLAMMAARTVIEAHQGCVGAEWDALGRARMHAAVPLALAGSAPDVTASAPEPPPAAER